MKYLNKKFSVSYSSDAYNKNFDFIFRKKKKRYRCKICGKDKFDKPSPHWCKVGFLKHYNKKKYKERYNGSVWEEIK